MNEILIQVTDLRVRYAEGMEALQGICFTLRRGESTALIGPNGAGKTTFFLSLAGVIPPTSGTITVCNIHVNDRQCKKLLPAKLGVLFQDSDDQIFNPTVRDDVAFGPLNLGLTQSETKQRTIQALQQVGLSGYEDRVPHRLSGGEKRRVAIAGLLAMQPEVLLLDEPSQHLDPRGRTELITLLNSLPQTLVIASHDLKFISKTCKRCIIIDQGRIQADGPCEELLSHQTLLEKHGLWE